MRYHPSRKHPLKTVTFQFSNGTSSSKDTKMDSDGVLSKNGTAVFSNVMVKQTERAMKKTKSVTDQGAKSASGCTALVISCFALLWSTCVINYYSIFRFVRYVVFGTKTEKTSELTRTRRSVIMLNRPFKMTGSAKLLRSEKEASPD